VTGAARRYYKHTRNRWAFDFQSNSFTVGQMVTVKEEGVRDSGFLGFGRVVVPKTETSHWLDHLKITVVGNQLMAVEGTLELLKGTLSLKGGILKIEGDVLAIRTTGAGLEVFIVE
jgi:hypothetical protein